MKITKRQLKTIVEAYLLEQQLTQKEATENAKYTVVSGDTLVSIAKKFGIQGNPNVGEGEAWEFIAQHNDLEGDDADNLEVGQEVLLPSIKVHKVESGDSLIKVAYKYGIASSLSDKAGGKKLRDVNNLKSDDLDVGQILLIPSGQTVTQALTRQQQTTDNTSERTRARDITGVSESLVTWIMHEEGGTPTDRRAGVAEPYTRAYNDGTGVATIGFGHTTRVGTPPRNFRVGFEQDATECEEILRRDLAAFARQVRNRYPDVELLQNEFDAIVSLFFNQGGGGTNRRIGAALRDGSFTDYNANFERQFTGAPGRARGVRLGGLPARREREWTMFSTGDYICKHTGENVR
jgi:GH24 family phage-related lysozyme (muramidase)